MLVHHFLPYMRCGLPLGHVKILFTGPVVRHARLQALSVSVLNVRFLWGCAPPLTHPSAPNIEIMAWAMTLLATLSWMGMRMRLRSSFNCATVTGPSGCATCTALK